MTGRRARAHAAGADEHVSRVSFPRRQEPSALRTKAMIVRTNRSAAGREHLVMIAHRR
jgi:hypothetical protein